MKTPPLGFGILALLFLATTPADGDYCWFFFSCFLVGVTELSLIELLGAADESLIAGSFLARTGFLFLAGKVMTLGACCCIVAGSIEWGYWC